MTALSTLEALKAISEETHNKDLKKECNQITINLQKGLVDLTEVTKRLSEYILNFEDAILIRKHLCHILLALVALKIPLKPVFSNINFSSCSDAEKVCHIEHCVVLSLLSDHPDILQYALKYFEINSVPPFDVFIHHEESFNVAPKKRRLQNYRQKVSDYQIVHSCYNLLIKLPNYFSDKWSWSTFITNFSENSNTEIRWMVKECISILTNMTESQSRKIANKFKITKVEEMQYLQKMKNDIQINYREHNITGVKFKNVVNIDGILLPIFNKDNVQRGILVPVKSTVNNLRSLALAVASGKALSLMGPVGSGKTSLVEHLSAITGRKGKVFKKVQLGDQTDSRMLLGTHQCTDIPGEFVWKAGVLTQAVEHGYWLLLEDIDCATLDVASTLSSLLERNTLCVPGYKDSLPVSPGFQLFVTQRTILTNYGYQKKISNASTLLQKQLTQINVEPLSRSELKEIIETTYPALTTICAKMIEVFMLFSVGSHDKSLQSNENFKGKDVCSLLPMRGHRLISTRDLMKWCARAVVGFEVTSPDSALKVLQDALDIFTCSIASPESRLELAKTVGTCLGIVETKSEFFCVRHKPNVSLKPGALEVGRAKVKRKDKLLEPLAGDKKQVVFSFTRQSACLLERIACCIMSNEPVLLVGETGTGKTSSVQYLAKQTGHKLVVINMNQQSDSADLLGGYKPVDMKYVVRPIKIEYENLFKTLFNVEKNKKFLNHIKSCYDTENWSSLLVLIKQSYKAGLSRIIKDQNSALIRKWTPFSTKLEKLELQVKAASRLTFAFLEGSLVKAMQEGHWVLLDEINLASAEILECLAGLLEDKIDDIELHEKGDNMPIKRHPEFTLFACMNPATDVGKKDLPVGLRNRFTEFFIDELTDHNSLILLVGDYLYHMNLSASLLDAICKFYLNIKKEAQKSLVDGAGNAPHYSLRTLCRALTAAAKAKCGTVSRSLFEAFCLSFLTQLDHSSHPKVEAMIAKAVTGKKTLKSVLNQIIPEPQIEGMTHLLFEGHWIAKGQLDISIPEGYILTQTVRKNLRDIARIISLGKLPVLLQGDTSVGKTSLITYIAKASGNYCVRINNHEHTDLQEYIGSYASDANGKLVFKEGVLVEAMRKGYWLILDELNLAPSDVLEALNRVLDDNRELFIPETQEVVQADPNFMLFATQNPPGLYGGRKMLSRAFRNRFVELHFDDIPRKELETILNQRCHIPLTYSKKMIAVMAELQIRRRGSAAVQGKDGFITLRDLFRWGQRYKLASKDALTDEKFYDWDQHIADEGYLVLAGKVRKPEERSIIVEVIEKHIKRKVNPHNLFSLHQSTSPVTKSILESVLNSNIPEFSHVVWTFNMRRLAVLIAKSFGFNEPVLLVGETGCGKTTICQVLAALRNRKLLTINCHMHTESTDFLGGLRPIRQYKNDGKLFEWVDGPLVKAMESGYMFLADEISLADDSVLERLNSLLEPERQLVLAERGTDDQSDIIVITADNDFHFIGTMNPGGDFGKKELSPALRNRFTEIWCDNITSREDLLKVIEKSVITGISLGNQEDGSSGIGKSILEFTEWLKTSEVTSRFPFSIRDLLGWVNFINQTVSKGLLNAGEAYVHGACMAFLDCFGTALTGHIDQGVLIKLRTTAIQFLIKQVEVLFEDKCADSLINRLCDKTMSIPAERDAEKFGFTPFYVDVGPNIYELSNDFAFTSPTTGINTVRLIRGMQLNKPLLLEGNPGVGKTSLVTALAKVSGHKVVRINLSDQTDITDLFGTDLPSDDGSFIFKEGVFLKALQDGDWILLDELNLAPQSVLEGLNACLDHRGEIYIPELGMTFKIKKETRLFACQNPLKQGGARKGLPLSFLNRFTQVYIDTLTENDLMFITESLYPTIPNDVLHRIVRFTSRLEYEINTKQMWGHKGSPWEMNLRDIQRWCEAIIEDQKCGLSLLPGKFVDILYTNRMRTYQDKKIINDYYDEYFLSVYPRCDKNPQFMITNNEVVFGDVFVTRNPENEFQNRRCFKGDMFLLRNQTSFLRALAQSVKMNWLSIVVGSTATGKSSCVQMLADLTGNELQVVPVTSAMDISDLLGGFEQVDYNRNLEILYEKIERVVIKNVRQLWITDKKDCKTDSKLLSLVQEYNLRFATKKDKVDDIKMFTEKINYLLMICDNLLKFYSSPNHIFECLKETQSNLEGIRNKINGMSSLNPGGRFEWVDSVLVKSMMKGSWILLDNVNLTSAAVLDRLNGLLETNGVLSIPERGQVTEIIPHKNFRIFFTMDPKYGEISRAMRNRGVELFILSSDEMNSNLNSLPRMDLLALINSSGLPSQYHSICEEAHKLMCSFIQGLDRPTVSHLLQATYLTWQQIRRGIFYKIAITNSFSDVYIKPRCENDFASTVNINLSEMKNCMLKLLESLLEKHSINNVVCTYHTMSIAQISKHSEEEIVKQIAYPLLQPKFNQNCYQNLFDLLLAYNKTSSQSTSVLKLILQQELNSTHPLNTSITKLSDVAFEALNTMDNIESYKRYYTEVFMLTDEEIGLSNAKFLIIYNNLQNHYNNSNIKKDSFSALDYSKAVSAGTIIDDFVEYSILKDCKKYIDLTDTALNELCNRVCCDDEVTCKFIQLLNWRTRFIESCSSKIFVMKNRRPVLKNEVIPLLYMHGKWLQKRLLDVIIDKLPNEHDLKKKDFQIIDDGNENSHFVKTSKKLRKIWGQPKLYKNQIEYERCILYQQINSKICINLNYSICNQSTNIAVQNRINSNYILSLDVPEEDSLLEIQEIANLPSNENKTIPISAITKSTPFIDFIIIRMLNLIQSNFIDIIPRISGSQIDKAISSAIYKDIFKIDVNNILPHILAATKEIKAFIPKFTNVLELITKLNNSDSEEILVRASSFTVKFWNEFYKQLTVSPARRPDFFFYESEQKDIVDNETNDVLIMNMPIMLYLIQNLTLSHGNLEACQSSLAFEQVSLQDRVEYLNQLTKCHNMLWKNISMIKLSSELKLLSDAVFEIQKYQQLICCLYLSLTDENKTEISLTDETFEQVIQKLKAIVEQTPLISTIMNSYNAYKEITKMVDEDLFSTCRLKCQLATLKLSLFTSIIFAKFMANMNPVDEVEKQKLKVAYIEEDIKMFDMLLSSYYIQGVVSGTITEVENCLESSDVKPSCYEQGNPNRENLMKVHPYCKILLSMKDETANKIYKYSCDNTYRPLQPSYYSFSKDCKHFANTILSTKTTDDISSTSIKICESLLHNIENSKTNVALLKTSDTILKETSSWLFSVKAFYKKLENDYSEAFPDLAKPLLSSLSQMIYSITNVRDLIKQVTTKIVQGLEFSQDVSDLLVYPNMISKPDNCRNNFKRFIDSRFISFIKSNVISDTNNKFVADSRILELLKMNLSEIKMHCYSAEQIDDNSKDAIITTLHLLVKAWETQQDEIRKKKEEDDALYVTKSKCEDEDEDFEAQKEISEMFPSYSETDFSEFKSTNLEQRKFTNKSQSLDEKGRLMSVIKAEDISMIYKWHSNLVLNLTYAEWLQRPTKVPAVDYTLSVMQRYPLFSEVIKNAWLALDASFEGITLPSLLLLMSNIKAKVEGIETQNSKVDFYRSSWVSETKQCLPLLLEVRQATNVLLDLWPDFPTLKDIILIVNRILNFPLSSPVARFLTGLELLRDKIEEWNKNAHKGNNMVDISLQVGQQIVNWRKLEMGHWKECLNNVYARKQSEGHKYWFHLYNIIQCQLEDENDLPILIVREFMEKSNLAEFEVRLDMLYIFHCHLLHLEKSVKRDKLISILWNIHNYYAQFSAQVATHIKDKRAPIEKKLKDFVKICTWDRDLSYWSVKDTVDKAHKVLHKHTKEFQKILEAPVTSCLVIDNTSEVGTDHVGIWDRPKRTITPNALTGGAYMTELQHHLALQRNVKKYLDDTEDLTAILPENSLLLKVPNLFNKAKTLCKNTMNYTKYPTLVQALDDFVTQVIETSNNLGSLEVDAAEPKNKQTSQAKSILQQKRKGLADLFRYLAKMGLNYRTGIVILSGSENLYDFTIPPVNLDAAISYLKNKRCDASLSLLWSGCEKYFQKNIARHQFLTSALSSPHQDLGMQNMDRCRGFAAILMSMTNNQKKLISKFSRQVCDLRNIGASFTSALDLDLDGSCNIGLINNKINIIFECYTQSNIVLEQFSELLKSCPEKIYYEEFEPSFDEVFSDSPIVNCYKNSEEWKKINNNIKAILRKVKKHKTALLKLNNLLPNTLGKTIKIINISQLHIDVSNEAYYNLSLINTDIKALLKEFEFNLKASSIDKYKPRHPLLISIDTVSSYIDDTIIEVKNLESQTKITGEKDNKILIDELTKDSEDLIATMLLVIQFVYKEHSPKDKNEDDVVNAIDELIEESSQNGDTNSKEILEDNHLKDLLQDKLTRDIKILQMDALIEKTVKLNNKLVEVLTADVDTALVKEVAMKTVAIFEQLMLFVQYFFTQQVAVHRVSCKMLSVLLKIFSDLSTKGFCKPSDIDMDGEGEGGPGQLSGGTGLGDGEGKTDVSDKIENQDQLDDAKRPGEEKKEEERDCKEEEKGVNMTDDFESHLQDVDKKDEDENEQDDNEDNADKQMGETDNAAEKLDQQIWGSEDEDVDEEEKQNDKEEKGKGESTGEKEMAAKEKEDGTDDGNQGKEKDKKQDINEMQDQEVDDDHVDAQHGVDPNYPEPEDFELPENMNLDGNENGEDGETENENPFEITKEDIPKNLENEEETNEEKEKNEEGLQVSSDDEGDGNEQKESQAEEKKDENQEKENENDKKEGDDATLENDNDNNDEQENEEQMEQDQENAEENTKDPENLPKNPDKINEDDEVEEKKDPNPDANPSNNDASQEEQAEGAEMDKGTDDNVQVNPEQQKDDDSAPFEQAQEQVGDERQATGRADLDKSDKGHQGQKDKANQADANSLKDKRKPFENKPGVTEQERTLAEVTDKKKKKTHTLNVEKDEEAMDEGADDTCDDDKEADVYQHVKQAHKDDIQAVDAATKEQAEQQPIIQQEDEEAEELQPEDELPMEVDDDDIQVEKSEKELKSEKTKQQSDKKDEKGGQNNEPGEEKSGDTTVEVEGITVPTYTVPRGGETTYHTRRDDSSNTLEAELSRDEYVKLRGHLQPVLGGSPASEVWRALWVRSSGEARALCERLRLVLEPTARSRLAGDYRSGRRINMRRVIPYIASQFRKDRIWLRRTRPAKRDYKIAVAIDDSSSMADNRSKELAFESLALVSQALNLLESGDLSVLSFGEKPTLLHQFSEQFSEHSGGKVVERLLFDQTKTKIAELLDFCTIMFDEQSVSSDAVNAKLLVVVSDGRGIYSEGETRVVQAVRRARQHGIFLVYVIIDNPDNKDSIIDIRRPVFDPTTNSLSGFASYLDTFPFPYYVLVRDMTTLPTVLADALRQWFELAAT